MFRYGVGFDRSNAKDLDDDKQKVDALIMDWMKRGIYEPWLTWGANKGDHKITMCREANDKLGWGMLTFDNKVHPVDSYAFAPARTHACTRAHPHTCSHMPDGKRQLKCASQKGMCSRCSLTVCCVLSTFFVSVDTFIDSVDVFLIMSQKCMCSRYSLTDSLLYFVDIIVSVDTFVDSVDTFLTMSTLSEKVVGQGGRCRPQEVPGGSARRQ